MLLIGLRQDGVVGKVFSRVGRRQERHSGRQMRKAGANIPVPGLEVRDLAGPAAVVYRSAKFRDQTSRTYKKRKTAHLQRAHVFRGVSPPSFRQNEQCVFAKRSSRFLFSSMRLT